MTDRSAEAIAGELMTRLRAGELRRIGLADIRAAIGGERQTAFEYAVTRAVVEAAGRDPAFCIALAKSPR